MYFVMGRVLNALQNSDLARTPEDDTAVSKRTVLALIRVMMITLYWTVRFQASACFRLKHKY